MKKILGPGAELKAYEHDTGPEIVLLTGAGVVLGRYLKAADITVTDGGKLVGYGNLLMSLLPEEE